MHTAWMSQIEFRALKTPECAQGTQLPAALVLGEASMTGRMEGSQLAPEISATWAARGAEASGTAALSRNAMRFTCQAPALEASGALFLRPPPLHAVKTVVTQARPRFSAADVEATHHAAQMVQELHFGSASLHVAVAREQFQARYETGDQRVPLLRRQRRRRWRR